MSAALMSAALSGSPCQSPPQLAVHMISKETNSIKAGLKIVVLLRGGLGILQWHLSLALISDVHSYTPCMTVL